MAASSNCSLVKLHNSSQFIYKARNIYSNDERFIYFFSDPPHLIKTVRNCCASPQCCLWAWHAILKLLL